MRTKLLISALTLIVAFATMFLFAGCADDEAEQPEEMIDYEIALITDDSLINDGGTSEVVWNTITDFGSTRGISHKYYKAAEAKSNAVKEVIDNAVSKGAKVIIIDNSPIANIVFDMQDDYEDIDFITINTDPYYEENGDILIKENTAAITFATEEAGYLAGYAAVMEGYTDLGCIVEGDNRQMDNYIYGFAKGANRAASDTGVTVSVRCKNCDESKARSTAASTASKWYEDGTEVIFVCGDKIEDVVIEEAETCEGKVICGITDKGMVSDTVLISSVENINSALTEILQKYTDNEFPGGMVNEYSAANDGVALEYKNSRLEKFSKEQYDDLFDRIKTDKIRIKVNNIESIDDLDLSHVEFK